MQTSENMRKIPKQARALETKKDLMTATAQFLRQQPYSKLSTNKIAELAGVSIGTLYQYYASKEALIVDLVGRQFEADFLFVQRLLEETATESFDEGVAKIVHAVLGMFSEQTQLRLVIYEQARKLDFFKTKESFQQRIRSLLLQNFEKHSRGEYVQPDEMSLYLVTQAAVGALVAAASERPEYLVCEKFEAELVRLILGYYHRLS